VDLTGDTLQALRTSLEQTEKPVYLLDGDGRIAFANAAAERLLGRTASTLVGQLCRFGAEQDGEQARLETCLAMPPSVLADAVLKTVVTRLPLADGALVPYRAHFVPLVDPRGRATCVLAALEPAPEESKPDPTADAHAALQQLRQAHAQRYGIDSLIGDTPVFHRVLKQVAAAARADWPALLTGEPGTGKQVVARAIHYSGHRRDGPFVTIEVSRMSADLAERELWGTSPAHPTDPMPCYEAARGGTLFIDELASLPRDSQARLADELADDAIDRPRLIVGTAGDPGAMVAEGTLRDDLRHALSVMTIPLPPLRERIEDVPLLAQHFVERWNRQAETPREGLAPEAVDLLSRHDWPGNVHELREVIALACQKASGVLLVPGDLPPRFHGPVGLDPLAAEGGPLPMDLDDILLRVEKKLIGMALRRARGNKTQAAQLLKVSRPRLYRRMETLGLDTTEEDAS